MGVVVLVAVGITVYFGMMFLFGREGGDGC